MRGSLVPFALYGAFFVLLHQPDGREVYANAEQVDYIAPSEELVNDKRAGARVMVYGVWVWVRERPEEIKRLIDTALGQDKK